jgi:hypothetical protein
MPSVINERYGELRQPRRPILTFFAEFLNRLLRSVVQQSR